jgi:hypothetical protein
VRTAAEYQTAVEIAAGYRAMARSIEADPRVRDLPVTKIRLARIARRAAIGEEVHPPIPDDRECSICGRVRSCLAVR